MKKTLLIKSKLNYPELKKTDINSYGLSTDKGIISPTEISELQGSLIELNNDEFDMNSRMSKIDMRTRLYNIEITSILAIDTLTAFRFLPDTISPLTTQKKRLAVSLNGQGRKEIVDIVGGKREHDQGSSIMGGFRNMFQGGKQ